MCMLSNPITQFEESHPITQFEENHIIRKNILN